MDSKNIIYVGVIIGSFGVRGTLRVKSLSDVSGRFEPGEKLYLETKHLNKQATLTKYFPGGLPASLEITNCTWKHSSEILLDMKEISDREQAAALRGASLFIKKSQTAKTEDADTFFHYQLIGLEVFQGKEKIGNIESIQDFGATDLLEIKRDNKEILIPFTVQFVKEIDLENGTMQIEVPPELLDV